MDMFSEVNNFLEENELSQNIGKSSILNHLQDFTQWFDNYFTEDTDPQKHDWILSPFAVLSARHPSVELIEALDDLSSDRGLRFKIFKIIRGVWLNFGFRLRKNIHSYQRLQ